MPEFEVPVSISIDALVTVTAADKEAAIEAAEAADISKMDWLEEIVTVNGSF